MSRSVILVSLSLTVLAAGCGRDSIPVSGRTLPRASVGGEKSDDGSELFDSSDSLKSVGLTQYNSYHTAVATTQVPGPGEEPERPADGQPRAPQRRIIYTATVSIVVDSLITVSEQITERVAETGGYVAEFREDRTYGDQRTGHWVVRIPVDKFQQFLDDVSALGVPESRQINAEEVSEEYIDLEERLRSKRVVEQRLLTLLEERAGELKDVIDIELKLGSVREEIERVQGRLRYLADRIALTSVTISAREDKSYAPPQAPNLWAKIGRTFFHSIDALTAFGQGLLLCIVAATPWLLVGVILLVPLVAWWRRVMRTRA